MCGIVGAWKVGSDPGPAVARACELLQHRGPDDRGVWTDPSAGIAFGHTRLAILDLSQAGHQPMASSCGRFQMIFNGEIYNHLELRARLTGEQWRGHSDSETLLACFRAWGVERTLTSTVGMFALALFDMASQQLYLARDRLGEKPLCYGFVNGAFAFASEARALRGMSGFDASIDRDALREYLRLSYVASPRSIYSSLRKLPPGSWLTVSPQTLESRSLPEPKAYWSAAQTALTSEGDPVRISDDEAIAGLERVLGDAVQGQMISDVPLGAFLSGGIDSSTVVALMQSRSRQQVRTFSIGFQEADFDESEHASLVARHLGTDHTTLVARGEDLLSLADHMACVYDEPFADASQLPTCLVASLARRHVTVALSGDGGDELFGGYNRHTLAAHHWHRLARIPRPLRRVMASGLRCVSPELWDRLADAQRAVASPRRRVRMLGDKMHKIADVLASETDLGLYRSLVSHRSLAAVVVGGEGVSLSGSSSLHELSDLAHRMMLADAISYLPDDILVKVDRAAMAVSLETRVPMLDHRVFEYAWRLPLHMKIRHGRGKWLLRQLLYRYVPRALVERPKMGFAVPLSQWLRGPLREWAEDLLAESRLRRDGLLEPGPIRRMWQEHLSRSRDWQFGLWNVLMFQAWAAQDSGGRRR